MGMWAPGDTQVRKPTLHIVPHALQLRTSSPVSSASQGLFLPRH